MEDFIKNVAGLDLYAIAHMTPDALRATLVEYRMEAIVLRDCTSANLANPNVCTNEACRNSGECIAGV